MNIAPAEAAETAFLVESGARVARMTVQVSALHDHAPLTALPSRVTPPPMLVVAG
jgi:hypothetical protein